MLPLLSLEFMVTLSERLSAKVTNSGLVYVVRSQMRLIYGVLQAYRSYDL